MYEKEIKDISILYVEESHVRTTNQSSVAQKYFSKISNFKKIRHEDRIKACVLIEQDPQITKYKNYDQNLEIISTLERMGDFDHELMKLFIRKFVNEVLIGYAGGL